MLEGQIDAVIGVDTHRDRHAAALLDPNGGVRATLPGCCSWPRPRPQAGGLGAGGDWVLWGGLTRFLVDRGEWVIEIDRPKGPAAATGPRAMPWTPSGPAARPWPATTSPAPASAGTGRPCGCCIPPGPVSWPPGPTPAASSRPRSCHRPRAAAEPPAGAALAPAGPGLRQACGHAWWSGGAPRHRAGA